MTTSFNLNTASTLGNGAVVLPLTTIFTPPAGCPPYYDWDIATDSQCQPPDFAPTLQTGGGYYSPGVCPSGYTIGCTAAGTELNGWSIFPGETAALCVPSLFTCSATGSGTIGVPYVGYVTIDPFTYSVPTSVRTYHNFVTEPASVISSIDAVQIRWRESDLSILESQSTATTAGTTTSSSPTQNVPPSTSGSGDTIPPGGSRRLSTGAIAGIVVGSVVLLLSIAIAIAILIRRRKRRVSSQRPGREEAELDGEKADRALSELPTAGHNAPWSNVHEMDAAQRLAVPELASGVLQQPSKEASLGQIADKHREPVIAPLGQSPEELPADKPIRNPSELPSGPVDQPPEELPALPPAVAGTAAPASAGMEERGYAEEMASLGQRQSQLLERKRRLMELETIEAEEERIRQRMEFLDKQRQGKKE